MPSPGTTNQRSGNSGKAPLTLPIVLLFVLDTFLFGGKTEKEEYNVECNYTVLDSPLDTRTSSVPRFTSQLSTAHRSHVSLGIV